MAQETLIEAIDRIYNASEEWVWKDPLMNLEKPPREPLNSQHKSWIRQHWAEGITIEHPMIREHLQLALNIIYPQYPVTTALEEDAQELITDSELSEWLNWIVTLPID
jgi:hypothetical protein